MQSEQFIVHSAVSQLSFHVEIPAYFKCMSFIMVKDANKILRMVRLLGHGEHKLSIADTASNTSVGAIAGNIPCGEWEVSIGSFKEYLVKYLGDKEVEVHLQIHMDTQVVSESIDGAMWMNDQEGFILDETMYDFDRVYCEASRYYKGDFHTHTRLSDGKHSVKQAMQTAKQYNMDFYMPTEHNLLHTGFYDSALCIVPSIEVTTLKGHFNVFGLTQYPSVLWETLEVDGEQSNTENILHMLQEANDNQWLTSINHPFLTIWSWEYDDVLLSSIQCLEIVNDPTYTYAKEANAKAISFLDALWMDGHKITGLGGSDSHNLIDERYEGASEPSTIGDPATFVYCEKLTPSNILQAVRDSNVYVSRYCSLSYEIYDANATSYFAGNELTKGVHYTYRVTIKSDKIPNIRFVENGQFVTLDIQKISSDTYVATTNFCFQDEWNWARIDVVSEGDEFMGYVNPVYSGKKKSQYLTYGEIKHHWQKVNEKEEENDKNRT